MVQLALVMSFKGEGTSGGVCLMYNGTTLANTEVEGYPTGDVGRGAPGNANDAIEYTIYYLNSGNVAAKNLRVCDRLNKNLVFQTQFDLK